MFGKVCNELRFMPGGTQTRKTLIGRTRQSFACLIR